VENLNDVEFGSDKSTEEAPILVAQRYLNIFRQIHIFNKEKRTQFDDELLTLPQNILDFYAKMPGGRLLIEHIEDVKTERGIAFVKSKKEDFASQDTSSSDISQPQGTGGNVVIDSSFADTLAKSMAAAFAQSAPIQSGNEGYADVSFWANLNKTFQLIAEEIKSSRTSLLEVMQENRKMAASIISSQQATNQLLDSLSKNGFSSPIHSLPQNPENIEKTPQHSNVYENVAHQTFNKTDDVRMPQTGAATESLSVPENLKKKKKKKKHNQPNAILPEGIQHSPNATPTDNLSAQRDISIKSEKIAPVFSGVIRNITSKHEDDFKNVNLDEPPLDDFSFDRDNDTIQQPVAASQNSIPHSVNSPDRSASNPQISSPLQNRNLQQNTETNDGLDFTLPEQNNSVSVQENETADNGLDSFVNDGLDFALPKQNNSVSIQENETADDGLDSFVNDGLDFALPEQNSSISVQENDAADDGLDNFVNDGLGFALPEQNNSVSVQENEAADDGLDNFVNDGLDFALPEQNSSISVQENETADDGLDSLMSDGLDFALPEQNTTSDIQNDKTAGDGLDSLIGDIQEVSHISQQNNERSNIPNALDDFSEQPLISPVTSQPETKSRYATELNKIREALTSDDIDISSLDEPIALDDYNDDENVQETSLDDYNDISVINSNMQPVSANDSPRAADETSLPDESTSEDEDWEWEYVDENGNPIEAADGDDGDWEWEYVEDDGSAEETDNNTK